MIKATQDQQDTKSLNQELDGTVEDYSESQRPIAQVSIKCGI